jgi:phospholipase C
VIIVVQENRSFDNLFWNYPSSDSTTNCALNHIGQCVPMVQAPLYQAYDLSHAPKACKSDYNGGQMNGFDQEPTGIRNSNPNYPYQYTNPSDVAAYWQMAQQYVLADRMFESNCGPSFPAHLMLISGQMGYSDNPTVPWGCDNKTFRKAQICYNFPTLADEMDAARISWKYYSNGGNSVKNMSIWQAFQAISQVRYGPDWTNGDVAKSTSFFTDVSGGRLPSVSWIVPTGVNSDHPGSNSFGTKSSDTGPAWVSSIVNAVGSSKYWKNTAIFVTWDDWGGWYDHVAPQQIDQNGLGFRVPLLVISPYAKRGYVSHVQHEFGSILHFTEEQFSLPSLFARDAISDDLSDCFDFTQTPGGFSPFAHGQYDHQDTSPPDDDLSE